MKYLLLKYLTVNNEKTIVINISFSKKFKKK